MDVEPFINGELNLYSWINRLSSAPGSVIVNDNEDDHYFLMEEIEGELTLFCWINRGRAAAYAYLYKMNMEHPSRPMMVWNREKYRNWIKRCAFGEGTYGS